MPIRHLAARLGETRLLILATVLIGIACAALVSVTAGKIYAELAANSRELRENEQWAIYQLQKEHLSTLLLAQEVLSGGSDVDRDLRIQYEILASRVTVLEQGRFSTMLRSVPQLQAAMTQLQRALETVDAAIAADRGDRDLAATITMAMAPLRASLQELALAYLATAAAATVAHQNEVRDLVTLLEIVFIGVLVMILSLSALAVVVAKRAEARRRALYTEQKIRALLEDSLEHRKLRALGTLAGGIAHEINTPAQWILDNLTFMREALKELTVLGSARLQEAPDGPRQQEHQLLSEMADASADAVDGVQRIAQIVRAVRPFATEADEVPEVFSIASGLQDALVLCRSVYRDIAVVEIDTGTADSWIHGPRQSFVYAIVELVSNAAQAIERRAIRSKGSIRIAVEPAPERSIIRIMDDGVGIPEEDLSKVFDPFFSTRSGFGVYGQGLAVCKSSIEARLHGRIALSSQLGSGTCVTITLPCVALNETEAVPEDMKDG